MAKKLFITGTGTDIGKTYVTGLIIKKLQEYRKNPAYYKAAMSGNEADKSGKLIPGDALFVKNMAHIEQPLDSMCSYIYKNAVSPHLASRIEGNPVKLEVVKQGYEDLCRTYDYITMEGSGGILCPICYDEAKIQLEDIIKELDMPCLIIADAGLGTINSVVLTVEYMKNRGISIQGIIFNHYHPGDVMEEDNRRMCEEMTGVKVISCVSDDDTELDIDIDTLLSLYTDENGGI